MIKRKLGESDLEISAIAFGAWAIGGWMWGGTDARDAVMAVEAAVDNGMTTIDTASVYGFGLSEEIVGKALRGKRDKAQILTKFGMSWDKKDGEYYFSTKNNEGKDIDIYKHSSRKKVIQDCEDSLRRLKTDYIDLFQIHWPDATTPVSETMETLELLIREGKIRAAGVCNYSADLLTEAGKTIRLASDQVPYSMVRRDIEKEIVPVCLKTNTGILAYSPLQRGLLSGRIGTGHKFNEGDSRPGTPYYREPNLSNILAFLDKLKPIAAGHNVTLSQLVLNWTIQQPGITCALAGARNPAQVLENKGAADFMLTTDEIELINNHLSETQINPKL
jgi:aryl-alcohol dehydrogenase-like predicted oxidoreductase